MTTYIDLLKNNGIVIFRSVPHQQQMNGHTECFNQTIDTKAEALRHQACLPPSYWEFCVDHGVFLYNRMPMQCLEWKTPSEKVDKKKPDLSKLRIFGCGLTYSYLKKLELTSSLQNLS